MFQQSLETYSDHLMSRKNFFRQKNSLVYKRVIKSNQQSIEIIYRKLIDTQDKNFGAMLSGLITITLPRVNQIVQELSRENVRPNSNIKYTIRSQVGALSPIGGLHEFELNSPESVSSVCNDLTLFILKWGIPFLDEYTSSKNIIEGYERNDIRLPHDHNELLIIAAAYVDEDRIEEAYELIHTKFASKAGLRREYKFTLDYLSSLVNERKNDLGIDKNQEYKASSKTDIEKGRTRALHLNFMNNSTVHKSGMKKFLLERQDEKAIENPDSQNIIEELQKIHPKKNSYFSLSCDDGSYVQAAGARSRLTVEYRHAYARGYTHYVIGHPDGDIEKDVTIACQVGPIRIKKNEVLTVDEAIEIFLGFLESKNPVRLYSLRDMTSIVQ